MSKSTRSVITSGSPSAPSIPHGSERANAMNMSASALKATPVCCGTIGWPSEASNKASVVRPPSAEIPNSGGARRTSGQPPPDPAHGCT
jgi:hypothetical protein